jgi:dienelactone hydrolase
MHVVSADATNESSEHRLGRRAFLRLTAAAASTGLIATQLGTDPVRAATAPCAFPPPFNPAAYPNSGKLQTVTPQSHLPLRTIRARTLSAWQSERARYLAAWRELIGDWPARPALKPTVLTTEQLPDYTRLKVSYQTLSGAPYASTIKAWLLIPRGYPRPRPAIVTLHQTIPQGKDEPAGMNASLPWYAFADYYARRGYVTLAPDAIGYGERTNGCYADTGFELSDAAPILHSRPRMTLLGLMLYDVTRAVDYLHTRPEVDRTRIGVMGHSLGGILTNGVLGLERRFAVGVASCGYGIFRTDGYFDRWAGPGSAYLPRMHNYTANRNALPIDMLQLMALAAPTSHLIQTALADTIWTPTAVAPNSMVVRELQRVHEMYDAGEFVHLEEDGDHGWYPEAQVAADQLFARVLRP